MNRYPAWKYILIVVLVVIGLIYAMPNLYGDDPALQITSSRGAEISEVTVLQVEIALEEANIKPVNIDGKVC